MGWVVRRFMFGTLLAFGVATAPEDARAAGMVLGAEPVAVRVAIAPGDDRTTRWYSLGVGGSAPVVWVLPVGREAAVDDASSAWLEALDVVTAPRVVPTCGGPSVEIVRQPDLGPTRHVSGAVIAKSVAELDAALSGVWPSGAQRALLEDALASHDLLVVRAVGPTTPTIRVVDRVDVPATVPLALTSSPRDIDVVVFVVADRRAALGVDVPAPATLHWFGQTSDYVLQRDAALAKGPPYGFVTESARARLVVDAQRMSPTDVPPLAVEYFERAAARYETTGATASCTNAATNAATSIAPVGCARASVAGTPLGPCVASSAFACGSLVDDLALGMGGLVPKTAWVTRLVGRIPAGVTAGDLPVRLAGGEPVASIKVALGGCALPPPSGSVGAGPAATDNAGASPADATGACGGSVDTGGGGDDCSDDTSGSSSSDNCDTSSSSDSGDACDSNSGSGDGCDGGSGQDNCDSVTPKDGRRTSGKSPMSRATLSGVIVLFGLRRWGKRRRASVLRPGRTEFSDRVSARGASTTRDR